LAIAALLSLQSNKTRRARAGGGSRRGSTANNRNHHKSANKCAYSFKAAIGDRGFTVREKTRSDA
jgi:hypothetical protein